MQSQEQAFTPLVTKLPTLHRMVALDIAMTLDAMFETSLQLILDGMTRMTEAPRRARR